MFDLEALKARIDLLALAQRHTSLQRVASSGGGEWAGPCPFCGGEDRFHVQPQASGGGRWLCRHCTEGKWHDAIAFGQRLWPGLSFQQVCENLAGGDLPEIDRRGAVRRAAPEIPAYSPPEGEWQERAKQAIEQYAHSLFEKNGATALDYLHQRGLKDQTIRHWQLGFSNGAKFGDLYIPPGIVIPCRVFKEIWYIKVALLPNQRVRCLGCKEETLARQPCPRCGTVNKYRGVKGNRPAAIFGAEDLEGAEMALFVEGEFDAMIAWQELRDVIAVCTLGSATNRPDLATWGPFLIPLRLILATYDADEAGKAGAAALAALSGAVRPCPLPPGAKDINDFYLSGGQLWPWLKAALEREGIV